MSDYYTRKEAERKEIEKYHDHPAFHHCFRNASLSEVKDMCEYWDKIAAYGVPANLIDNMITCGYYAGYDNANFDDGENDN